MPGRLGDEPARLGGDLLRPRDPDQRPPGDAQKTGSIYNFSPNNATQAQIQPRGTWVDYEVRVVGQQYTIIRNGNVIKSFLNSPDQPSSRPGDPSTNDRQFARGYIGLQNHGTPT